VRARCEILEFERRAQWVRALPRVRAWAPEPPR